MSLKSNEYYYEIPDNHLPVDDLCFLVSVPNDPMYVYAFMDAWHRLTTWLVWEKDEGKRAREVAGRWRKNSLPLLVCCDIKEAIDEDGCMSINVTVNTNCGCNDGTGGGSIINFNPTIGSGWCLEPDDPIVTVDDLPDQWTNPLNPEDPIPDFGNEEITDWSTFDSFMCRWATHVTILTGRTLVALDATIDNMVTVVAVSSWLGVVGIFAKIAEVGGWWLSDLLRQIIVWKASDFATDIIASAGEQLIDENTTFHQAVKCSLYSNRYSMFAAKSAFLQEVYAWAIGEAFNEDVSTWLTTTIDKLWPLTLLLNFGWLGKYFEELPEDGNCTGCGSAPGGGGALWQFPSNQEQWVLSNRIVWSSVYQRIVAHPKYLNPPDPVYMSLQRTGIAQKLGQDDQDFKLLSCSFNLYEDPTYPGFANGRVVWMEIYFSDDTTWASPTVNAEGFYELDATLGGLWDVNKILKSTAGGSYCIRFYADSGDSSVNGQIHVDNITLNVST